MINYQKTYLIQPDRNLDLSWSLQKAEEALNTRAYSVTDEVSPMGIDHINDYYSNGDYWWPDPAKADGLPYIRRDGYSNPDCFSYHRKALRKTRTAIAHLTRAYDATKNEKFAAKAAELLSVFFVDKKTAISPHLLYAQAIPGLFFGRGIGIIDTLHLVNIPFALAALNGSAALDTNLMAALRSWFAAYLNWLLTHPYGIDERNQDNNHGICYYVQVAAFALLTENNAVLDHCRDHFKSTLIKQMECDGSFPRELARTKPYGYSLFVLDNLVTLCQILSYPDDNLWQYEDTEGRSISRGISFILPFMLDKGSWPYAKDVMHFADYPSRMSFMLFAGYTLGIQELLDLYSTLPAESVNEEVRRNTAICQPFLWL
ncbi:MAG: alginate lyase family protein [Bacillota bacterium]|nr:alginate lyase family protein [Bacillota bacterium]